MLDNVWYIYRLDKDADNIDEVKVRFREKFSREPKYIIFGEGVDKKMKHNLSTRKIKNLVKLMKMEIALQ